MRGLSGRYGLPSVTDGCVSKVSEAIDAFEVAVARLASSEAEAAHTDSIEDSRRDVERKRKKLLRVIQEEK